MLAASAAASPAALPDDGNIGRCRLTPRTTQSSGSPSAQNIPIQQLNQRLDAQQQVNERLDSRLDAQKIIILDTQNILNDVVARLLARLLVLEQQVTVLSEAAEARQAPSETSSAVLVEDEHGNVTCLVDRLEALEEKFADLTTAAESQQAPSLNFSNVDERLLLNWDQTWHKFVRDKMKATRKPRWAIGKRVRRKLPVGKKRALSAALRGQIPETPRPGLFLEI